MRQRKIFRKLKDLDQAINDFYNAYEAKPVGIEEVPLLEAFGRVLAENIFSEMSVPPFDKSIVDGYAVKAEDTFRAGETNPVKLKIIERIKTGHPPSKSIENGVASEIDTGAMVPPGADAVVPVEYTDEEDGYVLIYKKVGPGANIMFSGTDIAYGELVIPIGTKLSSREIGMLAAIGKDKVKVYRKPKVAIFSIGDELVEPGASLEKGKIYDVNLNLLFAAVKEKGGEPISLGVAEDDAEQVIDKIEKGLEIGDIVLSSGSTSAGTSDIVYQVIEKFPGKGIIAHGLKIAPGKPTVISVLRGKPYIGLPGNPSSAINAFNLIVGPLIEKLTGVRSVGSLNKIRAISPVRIKGEVGRMIIQGVSVVKRENKYLVYPLRSGSGAVRTLGSADGFVVIPPVYGYIDSGDEVEVHLLTGRLEQYDYVIFAPMSPILDRAIGKVVEKSNINIKRFRTSSIVSLHAFSIGEADIAGLASIDPISGEKNKHLLDYYELPDDFEFLRGFTRDIGFVYKEEKVGELNSIEDLLEKNLSFINQSVGSDGREYFEFLLRRYADEKGRDLNQLRSILKQKEVIVRDYLSAISAVLNERGDVCIAPKDLVPRELDFKPLMIENFDFVVRKNAKSLLEELLEEVSKS